MHLKDRRAWCTRIRQQVVNQHRKLVCLDKRDTHAHSTMEANQSGTDAICTERLSEVKDADVTCGKKAAKTGAATLVAAQKISEFFVAW